MCTSTRLYFTACWVGSAAPLTDGFSLLASLFTNSALLKIPNTVQQNKAQLINTAHSTKESLKYCWSCCSAQRFGLVSFGKEGKPFQDWPQFQVRLIVDWTSQWSVGLSQWPLWPLWPLSWSVQRFSCSGFLVATWTKENVSQHRLRKPKTQYFQSTSRFSWSTVLSQYFCAAAAAAADLQSQRDVSSPPTRHPSQETSR